MLKVSSLPALVYIWMFVTATTTTHCKAQLLLETDTAAAATAFRHLEREFFSMSTHVPSDTPSLSPSQPPSDAPSRIPSQSTTALASARTIMVPPPPTISHARVLTTQMLSSDAPSLVPSQVPTIATGDSITSAAATTSDNLMLVPSPVVPTASSSTSDVPSDYPSPVPTTATIAATSHRLQAFELELASLKEEEDALATADSHAFYHAGAGSLGVFFLIAGVMLLNL